MPKVLLVDDEFLVCNFLRGLIPWESLGFILCGEAHNGREALESIAALQPDIALVDVSMPVMDGIELMRILQSSHSNIKVIILSSYSDYDYVRETMRLGAVDYLLKHRIDAQELLRVLETARNRIAEQNGHNAVLPSPETFRRFSPVLRDSSVNSFLEGGRNGLPPALLGLENTLLAAAEVHAPMGSLWNSSPAQNPENPLPESFLGICDQILCNVSDAKLTCMDDKRLVFLFPAFAGESVSEQVCRVSRCMNIVKDALLKYHNACLLWSPGQRCISPADLPYAYREALYKLQKGAAEAGGGDLPSALTLEQERNLLSSVYKGDPAELYRVLHEILLPFGGDKLHQTALQLLASDILTLAVKLYRQWQLPFIQFQQKNLDIGNLKQVESWLESLFIRLMKPGHPEACPYSEAVRHAVAYIEAHYMEDIGLMEAAGHCGVNSTYLSHLFKKEVGASFTQCLNRVRIAHSMKLMLLDDIPATSVSSRVGFNNYNHFYNIFKSVVGINPTAFRQDKKNMEQMLAFHPLQAQSRDDASASPD